MKFFSFFIALARVSLIPLALAGCGSFQTANQTSILSSADISEDKMKALRQLVEVMNFQKNPAPPKEDTIIRVGVPGNLKPSTISDFDRKVGELIRNDVTIEVRRDGFLTNARGTISVHDTFVSVQSGLYHSIDLPVVESNKTEMVKLGAWAIGWELSPATISSAAQLVSAGLKGQMAVRVIGPLQGIIEGPFGLRGSHGPYVYGEAMSASSFANFQIKLSMTPEVFKKIYDNSAMYQATDAILSAHRLRTCSLDDWGEVFGKRACDSLVYYYGFKH